MKYGDKVYYQQSHHVKQPAIWICWMIRGKEQLAMIQVKGSKQHIEVAPSDVKIGRE